jgi:hypothetical protein
MIKILSIAILAILLSGCVAKHSPVIGLLYTNTTHTGTGTGGVIDNKVKSDKVGTSTCTSVMNLVAYGDCSVNAAKKNGKITKVNSIDHQSTASLFYSSYNTIVKGE